MVHDALKRKSQGKMGRTPLKRQMLDLLSTAADNAQRVLAVAATAPPLQVRGPGAGGGGSSGGETTALTQEELDKLRIAYPFMEEHMLVMYKNMHRALSDSAKLTWRDECILDMQPRIRQHLHRAEGRMLCRENAEGKLGNADFVVEAVIDGNDKIIKDAQTLSATLRPSDRDRYIALAKIVLYSMDRVQAEIPLPELLELVELEIRMTHIYKDPLHPERKRQAAEDSLTNLLDGQQADSCEGESQWWNVGDRVQALYKKSKSLIWYAGCITRIDVRRGRQSKLHVEFDDGDKDKFPVEPNGCVNEFRREPAEGDMEINGGAVQRTEPRAARKQRRANAEPAAVKSNEALNSEPGKKIGGKRRPDSDSHSVPKPAKEGQGAVAAGADPAEAGEACEECFNITKWGCNIEDWPWDKMRIQHAQRLSPHHVAAGMMAKIYEPILGRMGGLDKMRSVLTDVNDWGCPFPDFEGFYKQRSMVSFADFESQHMTKSMNEHEKLWLRGAIDEALQALSAANSALSPRIDVDDRSILHFKKIKDKTSLDQNVSVDADPYGMLSGSVTELGDLEDATMHQTRAGGTCLYLAYPVAVVFSVLPENDSWLESPFDGRVMDVYKCGIAILEGNDLYGQAYRKLLADFLREQPADSDLRTNLCGKQLPPSFAAETSDDKIESWALCVQDTSQYADEVVLGIMLAFLPCVKPFIIYSSSQSGPYHHDPNLSVVPNLIGETYTGNCVGILLLFLVGGGSVRLENTGSRITTSQCAARTKTCFCYPQLGWRLLPFRFPTAASSLRLPLRKTRIILLLLDQQMVERNCSWTPPVQKSCRLQPTDWSPAANTVRPIKFLLCCPRKVGMVKYNPMWLHSV